MTDNREAPDLMGQEAAGETAAQDGQAVKAEGEGAGTAQEESCGGQAAEEGCCGETCGGQEETGEAGEIGETGCSEETGEACGAGEAGSCEEEAESSEEAEEAGEGGEADEAGCSEETGEAGECCGSGDEQAPGQEKEKKGFFARRKEKKDKKDAKIEELTDLARRQLAEFDNYRKRTEKEKAAMFEVGAKSVIEKILPVVDNFERGLAGADENPEDSFVVGMQMIYRQLMTTLEQLEVTPIEAVGKKFDPDFHNAVMHVEDESVGEGIVVEEFQKGYLYRGSVVRHSMVKVAN